MNEANVKGAVLWVLWQYLESEAGNDFSAGFSWLHGEINYIKANYPGKQVAVLFMISPYGVGTDSASQYYNFPDYVVNAGCTANQNNNVIKFRYDIPSCVVYLNRLLAAYGAEFDSEPALEYVRIDQETSSIFTGPSQDAGWKSAAAAAAAAFPTTQIMIPINWIGVDTAANKEAMLKYYQSIGVGTGEPDTQPKDLAYPCPSTNMPCVYRGLNASLGASSHDYCGEVVSMQAVELSEMGYNSVVDPWGGLTSEQVVTSWNNDDCAQYGTWDLNNNEIGDPDTMYWNGAHGQKWAINNIALTHTTKPAGYP